MSAGLRGREHSQEMELLACYGTLMAEVPSYPGAPDTGALLTPRGACLLPGLLYDCGEYPALVTGLGEVQGELYEVSSPQALALLDVEERYDPQNEKSSLYVRRRVRLITPDVEAWTYLWNGAVANLLPIPGGSWKRRLRL